MKHRKFAWQKCIIHKVFLIKIKLSAVRKTPFASNQVEHTENKNIRSTWDANWLEKAWRNCFSTSFFFHHNFFFSFFFSCALSVGFRLSLSLFRLFELLTDSFGMGMFISVTDLQTPSNLHLQSKFNFENFWLWIYSYDSRSFPSICATK